MFGHQMAVEPTIEEKLVGRSKMHECPLAVIDMPATNPKEAA